MHVSSVTPHMHLTKKMVAKLHAISVVLFHTFSPAKTTAYVPPALRGKPRPVRTAQVCERKRAWLRPDLQLPAGFEAGQPVSKPAGCKEFDILRMYM